jgi:hypothetical protein
MRPQPKNRASSRAREASVKTRLYSPPINAIPESICINNRKVFCNLARHATTKDLRSILSKIMRAEIAVLFTTITRALPDISNDYYDFHGLVELVTLIGMSIPNTFAVFSSIRPQSRR